MTIVGTLPGGEPVHRITLTAGPLAARILTYGATLEQLSFDGTALTHRLADLDAYLAGDAYVGGLVGPVANRIRAARFALDGRTHRLTVSEPPDTTLHGGAAGTHARHWTLAEARASEATLCLRLADGDGGFPGNRLISANYMLTSEALTLVVRATTDMPTVLNVTNHSYWHLGHGPTYRGLRLTIAADDEVETDARSLATGALVPVAGDTDFRLPRSLPADASQAFDSTLVIPGDGMRDSAVLESLDLRMTLSTDQPGLQVFDGSSTGYAGVALEAQRFPDAPNLWPEQVILRPGETSAQTTRWRIAAFPGAAERRVEGTRV